MEIEIKIPLSKKEYDAVKDKVEGYAVYNCKRDKYFSKYNTKEERIANNECMTRIRAANGKWYLTLKRKNLKDGVEVNEEIESQISFDKPVDLFELLKEKGYKEYFTKEKITNLWHEVDFPVRLTCELVNISNTYYFEIEVADYEGPEQGAIEAIKTCCKKWSLNYNDRDDRSWAEILGE